MSEAVVTAEGLQWIVKLLNFERLTKASTS